MTEVKVYSTPTCPWCNKTKEWLKENNIEFKSIDISIDEKAAEEMVEKSGQRGVPVIDIDQTIITGYDVSAMKKALNIQE